MKTNSIKILFLVVVVFFVSCEKLSLDRDNPLDGKSVDYIASIELIISSIEMVYPDDGDEARDCYIDTGAIVYIKVIMENVGIDTLLGLKGTLRSLNSKCMVLEEGALSYHRINNSEDYAGDAIIPGWKTKGTSGLAGWPSGWTLASCAGSGEYSYVFSLDSTFDLRSSLDFELTFSDTFLNIQKDTFSFDVGQYQRG